MLLLSDMSFWIIKEHLLGEANDTRRFVYQLNIFVRNFHPCDLTICP